MMKSGISKIVVRVDGSSRLGMGHIMRCLRLAHWLEREHSVLSLFVIAEDDTAKECVINAGFPVYLSTVDHPSHFDTLILPGILAVIAPDALLLDCNWIDTPFLLATLLTDPPIISLHEHNFPVLDEIGVAINPSLINQQVPPWGIPGKTHFQGADYLLLDEDISSLRRGSARKSGAVLNVLISLGGADPNGFTSQVIRELEGIDGISIEVVIGPAFDDELVHDLNAIKGINLNVSPSRLAPLLAEADIAIVNGATTMFESLALGVPTIAIPQNPYEASQAEICASRGAALSSGYPMNQGLLAEMVRSLKADANLRQSMRRAGIAMIDGRGVQRVGEIVMNILKSG